LQPCRRLLDALTPDARAAADTAILDLDASPTDRALADAVRRVPSPGASIDLEIEACFAGPPRSDGSAVYYVAASHRYPVTPASPEAGDALFEIDGWVDSRPRADGGRLLDGRFSASIRSTFSVTTGSIEPLAVLPRGFEIQAALAKRQASVPIVFVTSYPQIPDSVRAIRDGAVDFLTKPIEPHSLVDAVTRALARDAADRAERTRRQALMARYERLTHREREVLKHLISGQTNKHVAADLHISERTVKLHRAQIVHKLEIGSLARMVWFASDIGIEPAAIERRQRG
jgi:FixJ family two-component response regulator